MGGRYIFATLIQKKATNKSSKRALTNDNAISTGFGQCIRNRTQMNADQRKLLNFRLKKENDNGCACP
jgi:hypothetical protein